MAAPGLDVSALIAAPPSAVMKAFFDPHALRAWWQVSNAVTIPRSLGPYAIEWPPTEFRDELLGRLGGVFRGTVVECRFGESFLVTDALWLPPDGEPIGPMALQVTLRPEGEGATRVRVTQTGFEESARWRRYYEVIGFGWQRALASLKSLLEK
ncbi:MAG TPA: SRPBCC domain-containing protein [Vicinamibacterales bacterium]|nr:SRPBCC domain-containing protein [Vicinamibacterales bacterium]